MTVTGARTFEIVNGGGFRPLDQDFRIIAVSDFKLLQLF